MCEVYISFVEIETKQQQDKERRIRPKWYGEPHKIERIQCDLHCHNYFIDLSNETVFFFILFELERS